MAQELGPPPKKDQERFDNWIFRLWNRVNIAGEITLATSGVTAGTYGGTGTLAQIVVDTYGRVTSATDITVSVTGTDLTINAPLIGTATGAVLVAATIGHGTSGVTAGAYGDATIIPQVVVDTYGHVTAVNTFALTGTAVSGADVSATSPILVSGTSTNAVLRPFTVAHATSGVTPGTYGGAVSIPTIVVNTYGHVTSVSTSALSGGNIDHGALQGKADNDHTQYAMVGTVGHQNSILSSDARNTNYLPGDRNDGFYVDFKSNTAGELSDGGSYHGVLTFRPYGHANDFSGGPAHQLGFTHNGNIYHRVGTGTASWSAYDRVHVGVSGAIPATYGNQSSVSIITVDTYGHVTAGTSSAINIDGTAVTGADLTINSPLQGTVTNALLRAGAISHAVSGVTAGTYGTAANLAVTGTLPAQIVVDTYGHITAAYSIPGTSVSNAGANFGQLGAHTAYTDFDTIPAAWGWSYVIGTANGPGRGATQWYRGRFAIGSNYDIGTSANSYWLELAVPRSQGTGTNAGIYRRIAEAGVAGSWDLAHPHSGVTSGTYGNTTTIPVVTVDTYGHITSIYGTTAAGAGYTYTGTLTSTHPTYGTHVFLSTDPARNALRVLNGTEAVYLHAVDGTNAATAWTDMEIGARILYLNPGNGLSGGGTMVMKEDSPTWHWSGTGDKTIGVYYDQAGNFTGDVTGYGREFHALGNRYWDNYGGTYGTAGQLWYFRGTGGRAFFTISARSGTNSAVLTISNWKTAGVNGEIMWQMGHWPANADYNAIRSYHHTNAAEYAVLCANSINGDKNTYISAGSGAGVYIRSGNNNNAHSLNVTDSVAYMNGTWSANDALIPYRPEQKEVGGSSYELVPTDLGKFFWRNSTSAGTYVLGTNAATNGHAGFHFSGMNWGSGNLIIAPAASIDMRLVGVGATGTRTVAQWGAFTITKLHSTAFIISGVGIT